MYFAKNGKCWSAVWLWLICKIHLKFVGKLKKNMNGGGGQQPYITPQICHCVLINKTSDTAAQFREREMFYLTTHSTHFIYGYMASDIWLRTILIVRKETRCCHIGYSYRLTARVLLYAPSHRQDNSYHGLCYTSRGALAGTRNSLLHLRQKVKKCSECSMEQWHKQ